MLVLLDAEVDCPKELAEKLAARLRARFAHIPSAIVIAKKCYESWLLASSETIAGRRDMANFIENISDPETVPNPKKWLTERMQGTRAYKETSDQAALTEIVDLSLLRDRSRSFRRLEHALEQIITCLDTNTVMITP